VKEDFGERRIPLPVGEAKFDFDAGGFADEDASQLAGGGDDFEEDFVNGVAGGERIEGHRGGVGRRVGAGQGSRLRSGQAAQDGIAGGGGDIGGKLDAGAEAREFGLTGEKDEGRAPVVALLDRDASDGAVGGDVKPDVLPIHEEEFLFGGFVLPAHATGSAEEDGAGLETNVSAAFRIALEKSGLQGASRKVACFDGADENLDATGGAGRRCLRGGSENAKENGEEEGFSHRQQSSRTAV